MKGEGDRQDCNNYRGVTLLSVPGKVFAHILLKRIRSHLLKDQRPEQSGFTPKKSTIDRILALRVLVERRLEYRESLLAVYVDLKKAFDSVHRESLWELLRLRGIPTGIINLVSGLYSGTESAVRWCGRNSSFFPVNSGVRQGCVLAPSLFNTCMDWILGRTVNRSHCGASVGDVKITDLDFADDAVIFAESLEVLALTLEVLREEAEPLGLKVSWAKTKVQAFGDLLDDAAVSIQACGENIEVVDKFTYLGSVIHHNRVSDHDVDRRLGLAYGVMNSLNQSIWRCRYLCRRTKLRIFRTLVLPVLLYGCETWTLTGSLERRINSFGTKSLRRIMGYRWFDRISNDRLLTETDSRYISDMVRERQLRLYGHVARFSVIDPAHGVISTEINPNWRRPRGRPRDSWLKKIDLSCRDLVGMNRVLAWRHAREDPRDYRRRVSAATRRRGVSSP